MKNLDIDNLERKNIYTAPDNFFERMQENVLQKTAAKQPDLPVVSERNEARIVKMNWWYAAAAAVTLVFGTLLFMNRDGEKTQQIVQNETTKATNPVKNEVKTPVSESANNYQTLVTDLTSTQTETQTQTQPVTIAKNETPKVAAPKIAVAKAETKQQIEQLLNGLSEDEINTIAKNSDQDIYLDLYY